MCNCGYVSECAFDFLKGTSSSNPFDFLLRLVLKGQTRCSKDYDSPRGLCSRQIYDFNFWEFNTGLLRIQAVFTVRHVFFYYLPCVWASRKPITSVEFKFVARQVEASVVIRAAKLKFVAESRTRFYFVQHVASTCNIVFCCETSWSKRGNTSNRGFQLAMQQCCKTTWSKMLPVLPYLKSEVKSVIFPKEY